MDDNSAIFLLMAVAIVAAVGLTVATAWIRSGRQAGGQVASLMNENAQLKREVSQLEERLQALGAGRLGSDSAHQSVR